MNCPDFQPSSAEPEQLQDHPDQDGLRPGHPRDAAVPTSSPHEEKQRQRDYAAFAKLVSTLHNGRSTVSVPKRESLEAGNGVLAESPSVLRVIRDFVAKEHGIVPEQSSRGCRSKTLHMPIRIRPTRIIGLERMLRRLGRSRGMRRRDPRHTLGTRQGGF